MKIVLVSQSEEINQLMNKLNLELVLEKPENELFFLYDEKGLSLVKDDMILRADFMDMKKRLRTSNLRQEFIVKAAKIKGVHEDLYAIDATAGFAEDSLLLAASGFHVDLYERNPYIAALLKDALHRALQEEELHDIVSRMHLIEEDSTTAMLHLSKQPDVIYLDPMFPKRQKSGLIKKKFQMIQLLEQPCSDGDELLKSALAAHPKKVIVKRPLKGECLAGIKPTYSIQGKGIRYDCIIVN